MIRIGIVGVGFMGMIHYWRLASTAPNGPPSLQGP